LPKINAIVEEFCKEREIGFKENDENTKLICSIKDSVADKKEINVPHIVQFVIFNIFRSTLSKFRSLLNNSRNSLEKSLKNAFLHHLLLLHISLN
jgi:hypothetical protein